MLGGVSHWNTNRISKNSKSNVVTWPIILIRRSCRICIYDPQFHQNLSWWNALYLKRISSLWISCGWTPLRLINTNCPRCCLCFWKTWKVLDLLTPPCSIQLGLVAMILVQNKPTHTQQSLKKKCDIQIYENNSNDAFFSKPHLIPNFARESLIHNEIGNQEIS